MHDCILWKLIGRCTDLLIQQGVFVGVSYVYLPFPFWHISHLIQVFLAQCGLISLNESLLKSSTRQHL